MKDASNARPANLLANSRLKSARMPIGSPYGKTAVRFERLRLVWERLPIPLSHRPPLRRVGFEPTIRLRCGAPISPHDPPFCNVKFTVRILKEIDPVIYYSNLAPAVGFEHTTNPLIPNLSVS